MLSRRAGMPRVGGGGDDRAGARAEADARGQISRSLSTSAATSNGSSVDARRGRARGRRAGRPWRRLRRGTRWRPCRRRPPTSRARGRSRRRCPASDWSSSVTCSRMCATDSHRRSRSKNRPVADAAAMLDHRGEPGHEPLVEAGELVGRRVLERAEIDPGLEDRGIGPDVRAAQGQDLPELHTDHLQVSRPEAEAPAGALFLDRGSCRRHDFQSAATRARRRRARDGFSRHSFALTLGGPPADCWASPLRGFKTRPSTSAGLRPARHGRGVSSHGLLRLDGFERLSGIRSAYATLGPPPSSPDLIYAVFSESVGSHSRTTTNSFPSTTSPAAGAHSARPERPWEPTPVGSIVTCRRVVNARKGRPRLISWAELP